MKKDRTRTRAGWSGRTVLALGRGDLGIAVLAHGRGVNGPTVLVHGGGDRSSVVLTHERGDRGSVVLVRGRGDLVDAVLTRGRGDLVDAVLVRGRVRTILRSDDYFPGRFDNFKRLNSGTGVHQGLVNVLDMLWVTVDNCSAAVVD
ncbi:hypothetical protein Rs2_45049 [Raphanus sativus]|nr:hypothetical protein Rs2_45049 [Raphanus sativus]